MIAQNHDVENTKSIMHKVKYNQRWKNTHFGAHLEQSEVGLPLVPDDLATRETPDGDDHLSHSLKAIKHSDPVLYREYISRNRI